MEGSFEAILVVQTAFIGDAILTLPLIQALKKSYPRSSIDVVVVPKAAELFANHPAISNIIPFDKRGADGGIKGFWKLLTRLKTKSYDLIVVPHRSLRSALLSWLLKPGMSVGFDRSAGARLFKNIVRYNTGSHEIDRNLSLLAPLGLPAVEKELPVLYPSTQDIRSVDSILADSGLKRNVQAAAVAPGTIWNTKRWPADRFIAVCRILSSEWPAVILLGGKEDEALCRGIAQAVKAKNVINTAGKLSLLQSADLIRRCSVLISNDSAPMHLAVAVRTPVVAIFGATVPEFGFAPQGAQDIVIETRGLKCRPCSIHGGKACPVKTFECMLAISPEFVAESAVSFLHHAD